MKKENNTETIDDIISELRNVKTMIDVGVGDAYYVWRIRCNVCDEYATRIERAVQRKLFEYNAEIDNLHAELLAP